jgi:hypothetical protein
MDEAVRTTASPAAIWAICVVAVLCLAFWLFMINYADRHPYVRHRQLPDMPGPAEPTIAGAPAEAAAAPPTTAPEPAVTAAGPIPTQRTAPSDATVGGPTPTGAAADDTRAEAPTEPIPAQRSADADQAADTSTDGRS